MNANNDNQIVYIAKSKLLEIYNDIFYDYGNATTNNTPIIDFILRNDRKAYKQTF